MAKCTNRTSEIIAVYGPARPGEPKANSLYLLDPGQSTPPAIDWDCDGFFVPNDRIADQLVMDDRPGPVAVKYKGWIPFEPEQAGKKYKCGANQGIYVPDKINWSIPNLSHEEITQQGWPMVPSA